MKGVFRFLANAIIWLSILASIVIDIQIVWYEWGYRGILLSIFAFPLALITIPIISIIKYGRWLPALITYGGGLISLLFLMIGIENDEG